MTGAEHLASGRRAEDLALALLEAKGLSLLTRNYRCPPGELDLVLLEGETLVVLEVRYREGLSHGSAAESVDGAKQRRIAKAAQHFLQTHPEHRRRSLRFDVVAVTGSRESPAVEWIQDAFRAG